MPDCRKTCDSHRSERTTSRSLFTLARFAFVVLLMLNAAPGWAQPKEPPVSFRKAVAPLAEVAMRTMPIVDVERLRGEDEIADKQPYPGPTRFAAPIAVHFDLETSGSWDNLDDGGRLWRLRIDSPGALSLNLGFRHFDIPTGARLWIYDSRGIRVEGPYVRGDEAPGRLTLDTRSPRR